MDETRGRRAHTAGGANGVRAARARPSLTRFLGVTACLFAVPALGQAQTTDEIRQQQEMPIWTTEYEGLIDGIAGPETIKSDQ